MSKIALTPNASGSGTFTIAAPNSDTDRTLTLPDEAGTVLTSASDVGVTDFDMWRVTSNQSGDLSPISSGWERVDTDNYALYGSGVSQSSGVFTFPSTGFWFLMATFNQQINGSDSRYGDNFIDITTDNSSWSNAAYCSFGITQNSGGTTSNTGSCNFIFRVTDTSLCKARLAVSVEDNITETTGDTNGNGTAITFIRLRGL